MTCLRVYGPTLVATIWFVALMVGMDVVIASMLTAALFIPASVFYLREMNERIHYGHPKRRQR